MPRNRAAGVGIMRCASVYGASALTSSGVTNCRPDIAARARDGKCDRGRDPRDSPPQRDTRPVEPRKPNREN